MTGRRPIVSVVVPFRNGRTALPTLVDALTRQTLSPESFEVIFVDDGSTDDGATWLRAHVPAEWPVLAHPVSRGSYAARNTGLERATAPNLAFTDVDCRPRPDWLARGLAALEVSPRAAGHIQFDHVESPSVVQLVDMGRFFRQHQYVTEGFAATANLFARREVFDRVGGFDDALRWGGDYEIGRRCLAAGIPIVYAADVVVDHEARATLGALLKKGDHVGFGAGQIARRGGSTIGAVVTRALDRLSLTRRRGLRERDIAIAQTSRSFLVTSVLALLMAATALGFTRGFLLTRPVTPPGPSPDAASRPAPSRDAQP